MTNIPVFKPCYDHREEEAVAKVLRSGWVGIGPVTAELEEKFAKRYGFKYAVALNSCTAALHTALHVMGIKPRDEVIVPTMTFVSTAHAVRYMNATPIFCDIDPNYLTIDWTDAESRITRNTKAIIPVLYAGNPMEYRGKCGLPILYDCAHACGGKPFSTSNKTAVWSFHAVKNLAAGDGGMITTDDKEVYERSKRLRWLGIDRNTWDRTDDTQQYWWEYNVDEIGYKYHMNDITAAIALTQLEKLEEMQTRRSVLADLYDQALPIEVGRLPHKDESSMHLYVIFTKYRDALAIHLRKKGINTGVHYKPIHLYRCYGNTPTLPVAECVWKRILTLPLFPDLKEEQVLYICGEIEEFFSGKK